MFNFYQDIICYHLTEPSYKEAFIVYIYMRTFFKKHIAHHSHMYMSI